MRGYDLGTKPRPPDCRVARDEHGNRWWCVVAAARPTWFKHRPRWRVRAFRMDGSYSFVYEECTPSPRRFSSIADAQAWAHHWLDGRDATANPEPEIPVGRTMWDLALEQARREVEALDSTAVPR